MVKVDVHKAATLTGHKDCIYTLKGGEGESQFYSSGADGMIVKWDLEENETGELIAKTNNSVYALQFLSDSNQLLVGENFSGIHAIDIKNKKEVNSSAISESAIFDIQVYKDWLLVASGDGNIIVLDKGNLSTIIKLKLSDKSARSISINHRFNTAAIGFSDYFVRILDLENLNLVKAWQAHDNSVFTAVYSPDGKYLLTGGRDAHLKIWNVEEGYEGFSSIVAHMYAINDIAYSPDGKYFATCSMDKSVKLWDAESFRLLKVIDRARHAGHGTSVNKLYWSAYRNSLVSCSDDRTISIWNFNFN